MSTEHAFDSDAQAASTDAPALPPRPRPTDYAPAAAEAFLPTLRAWWRRRCEAAMPREEEAAALAVLGSVVLKGDAYLLARELDDYGWPVNAELVDLLNGYSTLEASHQAMRKWAQENRDTLQHLRPAIEQAVGFVHHWNHAGEYISKPLWYDGVVVHVTPEEATATVRVDALGHVASGEGTHGLIVGWEALTPVHATSEGSAA